MLGLHTLKLLEKARYISSVSGGTWASSIFSFLPSQYTDEQLLGQYVEPQNLSVTAKPGKFDINKLGEHSFGNVPADTGIDNLLVTAATFIAKNKSKDHQWLWTDIIATHILSHFDLRAEGEHSWTSTKSFSLSQHYAQSTFPSMQPSPSTFFYLREGRPFLIMNNNIMHPVNSVDNTKTNIVQLPNQATAVSAGARGKVPNCESLGGGQVESFAYASTLEQKGANISPVQVNLTQPYALVDIVSTSSSFFADALATMFTAKINDPMSLSQILDQVMPLLTDSDKKTLLAELKSNVEKDAVSNLSTALVNRFKNFINKNKLNEIADFIPRNNYWPIGETSQNYPDTLYTDGGTLDNTGVIGILSQTDNGQAQQEAIKLVIFDNTSTPLVKKSNIIAAGQAAPLFGIDYDNTTGTYQPFNDSQKDPTHPAFRATSLIQVFDNTKKNTATPFERLVIGLYNSSSGPNRINNSQPAFCRMELTTVENQLANISAGRTVEVLYIQNAKMLDWQNSLTDESLKSQIIAGQQAQSSFDSSMEDAELFVEARYSLSWDSDKALEDKTLSLLKNPAKPFANFPYYSTFFKIGLEPKESNALSQMWAWAIADDASSLKEQIEAFIEKG
ncbi:hypothetical protein S4054249_10675 [Pseudoalteromonas luteoviolacea]|uniref:PNPLA domain-containing protein n=2 Tax=Pseudoalteromonas luteoviolacea TaxID=43657 RepID=A0A0F6ADG8_9GAMM|nr:hypothetical protein S4054249_10675 [Pseudoalteromonas luteoviolacea]AOT13193.1 hypothetical protein S40542_10650 [Pseudoalteromonas luteoviolacea]AOT18106.1 hypothetical protein S4054_10650 [Pseudoalteromonas luteoviolacea]KKE84213.1 hypothetical protein N479_09955 [Pseudoalteromonas luteoviolacea S4054]